MQQRVILIGLDGGTFTVLDPLMDRGKMPFLRQLIGRSVRGPLRTVTPALTPPGWTSLMTGKRPGQHGVFDFFQKEARDSEYFRLTSSHDIHAETIWTVASKRGRRAIALNFPLTFPPPDVDGFVVPGGWMPWRQLRLGCHPPGLFDELKTLPSFNARELAMDRALEDKALEGCAAEEYADWIMLHTRREQRWADILRHLMTKGEFDLIGIVFDGVDKLQHLCWRFLDPACWPNQPTAWHRDITRLCEAYFSQLDGIIEQIVEQAGPDATVVLASDHGAGPTSDVLYLNTWLQQHGYLAWNENADVPTVAGPSIGMAHIARHVHELDWHRTVAYAATPSSFGVHVVSNGRPASAAPAPAARSLLQAELAEALQAVQHPATGRRLIENVETREQLFVGPYAELAPDLSLTLADGAVVSILRSEEVVRQRPEPLGSHRPHGIFVATGPGLRSDVLLEELSIVDVAPFVLHQLGLDIPESMAGEVPLDAFEPDELRRRAPRRVADDESASPATSGDRMDAEAEALVLRRLRALGYVE